MACAENFAYFLHQASECKNEFKNSVYEKQQMQSNFSNTREETHMEVQFVSMIFPSVGPVCDNKTCKQK